MSRYEYAMYRPIARNPYRTRHLGTSCAQFSDMPLVGSYPSSIPGVLIFESTESSLGSGLLGMTNGRMIILKDRVVSGPVDHEVKRFILFHEEEHVKDMDADELTIDRRACARFLHSHPTPYAREHVFSLLCRRWGALDPFLGVLYGKNLF